MKLKTNYSRVFSSPRAVQRYIICQFSEPIEVFSIFGFDSVGKSTWQRGDRSNMKGALSSQRGPLPIEETKGGNSVIRVDMVFKDRTHMSYLMRNNCGAPSLHKFPLLQNFFPAPFRCFLCLASPNYTQWNIIPKLHPQRPLITS
jgi:hypothetical protein